VAGAIIIGLALHAPSADSAVLLVGAGLVITLGLVTNGPAGVAKLLARGPLRAAEAVVAGVLIVLPFVQPGGVRVEVVVVLWVVAIALLRLVFLPAGNRGDAPAPAPPAQRPRPGGGEPAPSAIDEAVRRAGRQTGIAGRRARELGRQAQPAMLRGARALGRAAGRRQAGPHPPDDTH
jgi:hypothetical protein